MLNFLLKRVIKGQHLWFFTFALVNEVTVWAIKKEPTPLLSEHNLVRSLGNILGSFCLSRGEETEVRDTNVFILLNHVVNVSNMSVCKKKLIK